MVILKPDEKWAEVGQRSAPSSTWVVLLQGRAWGWDSDQADVRVDFTPQEEDTDQGVPSRQSNMFGMVDHHLNPPGDGSVLKVRWQVEGTMGMEAYEFARRAVPAERSASIV